MKNEREKIVWLCHVCGTEKDHPQVHWCDEYNRQYTNVTYSRICGGTFFKKEPEVATEQEPTYHVHPDGSLTPMSQPPIQEADRLKKLEEWIVQEIRKTTKYESGYKYALEDVLNKIQELKQTDGGGE